MTAAAYLSEPVCYGSETMSRGEMIAELERIAASVTDDPARRRALVNAYMQGHTREEN